MAREYLLDIDSRFGDPFPFHNVMPMSPFDKNDWQTTMRWANVYCIASKTKKSCKEVMHSFVIFSRDNAEKPPHHSLLTLWKLRERFGILEEHCWCKACGLQEASTFPLWDLDYFERTLLKQPKKYDYMFGHYLLPEKWVLYFLKTQTTKNHRD